MKITSTPPTINRITLAAICTIMATGSVAVRAAPLEPTHPGPLPGPNQSLILKSESFKHYIDTFNQNDRELYPQYIPNAKAWDFLKDNIPLLDCPDKEIEEIYYFRWWTYRKHIKETPDGFVISEFLPKVGWAGKHNTINCAAGHHLREGRWLHDTKFMNDYTAFWLRKGGSVRTYSFWIADSVWQRYCVSGDRTEPLDLLPDLIRNYAAWETERRDPNGLFWQEDGKDGMECSISGSGYRATINTYMYGDALAIARIADLAGKPDVTRDFQAKAAKIKELVQTKLWDDKANFFKVLPRGETKSLSDVRELHGLTPWYCNLPDAAKSVAWKQLMETGGFYAPYGPTTAEQRHPKYVISYKGHECQWNGPSWPFSTAITLTGLANLLNSVEQDAIGRKDYLDLLKIYTRSHRLKRDDGSMVPWIDENLDPGTGDWISRTRLKNWQNGTWSAGKGGEERGKDYNHSTYCDLIISGLIGLRPRADESIEVNPLIPEGTWDYFCLDNVRYHGRTLTILYDKTGDRYKKGKGLLIFADGKPVAAGGLSPAKLTAALPPRLPAPAPLAETVAPPPPPDTAGGWMKYPGNPVMGGKYGTCFDISVLNEADGCRMWLSWRPKASIAIVESKDGIKWSAPPKCVLGPRKETGWEDDINRPVVVKKRDGYHMWYTGQAKGRSAIGYAISPDGVNWSRRSERPVLSADKPWEKVAVMCPHVIWDEQELTFKMWYSGGEQNEPNALGYATSKDGLKWIKLEQNPIFKPEPANQWEKHKVTAAQVEKHDEWYLMFYIGFENEGHAQICLARSRDGITHWERHPANPIIRTSTRGTANDWDTSACYKPYAIFDGKKWLLWYNGRHGRTPTDGGGLEQIGVAIHEGEDLGFETKP